MNLVEDEPLYEYSIYLLPMGRRLKGKIPDKPQNIDTQYKEYKVNLDGKVSLMNCKVWDNYGRFSLNSWIFNVIEIEMRQERPMLADQHETILN